MCLHFQQKAKGRGCNLKKSKGGRGRPAGESPKSVIEYVQSIAPPSPLQDNEMLQFYSSPNLPKLLCSICRTVAFQPVELSCKRTVCSTCCCRAIQAGSLQCPCCSDHVLSSDTIHPPSPLFMSLLGDLLVKCAQGYGGAVKLEDYERHRLSKCRSYRQDPNSPSKITLSDVLGKPSTSPATPL